MADGLRLEGLSKHYGDNIALADVSLSVPDDTYISVLGPSGSGKTVLLRVIAGFEQPDGGTVQFGGERLDGVPAHRRGIGFAFQNFALFPHLSVRDNIAFGLMYRERDPVIGQRALRTKVEDIIELVGLTGLADRGVHQISGGQRQRVALARTLVTEPRLVLLDEPLGALDANLRGRMRGELRAIRQRLGVTFLHVTGSESEALAMGDRVIVLDRGRVGQFDSPDTVYNQPASPSVARFLNCYNIFAGRLEGGRFVAGQAAFATGGTPRAAAESAYCIRQDLIQIRSSESPPRDGEAGILASFVTSEYSGASVQYFFEADGGRGVEVEAHLGHRRPEELMPRQPYNLVWNAEQAVVFG
ncbi:MAG: ABC transporter ATP-binding protein [Rhodopila sp.]|nr:ABC transporter ATP-binding protein [Rhodopila sp.]